MTDKFSRGDFLEALFRPYFRENNGFIMVKTVNRNTGKTGTRYFPNIDTLARESYSQEQHTYFGPAPREKMKPDKEHVRFITALWAGLDVGPDGYSGKENHFSTEKQAGAAMRGFPLPPSALVKSGRGVHLYWFLKKVVEVRDPEPLEDILRRINHYFQCHSETGLDSCFRLPGTHNPKSPVHISYCTVEYLDTRVRYDLAQFDDLDLRIVIPKKRPPKVDLPPTPPPRKVTILREEEAPPREPVAPASPVPASSTATPSNTGAVPLPDPPDSGHFSVVPVPYEDEPDSDPDNGARLLTDEEMDEIADRVMQKFDETVADRMIDRIVDRVVDRVVDRLSRRNH